MPKLSVALRSSEIRMDLLQQYRPDNWTTFVNAILNFLKRELAAIKITALKVNILPTGYPGPLILSFDVESQLQLTAEQLKQTLRR